MFRPNPIHLLTSSDFSLWVKYYDPKKFVVASHTRNTIMPLLAYLTGESTNELNGLPKYLTETFRTI